jgi:hypothetical protein
VTEPVLVGVRAEQHLGQVRRLGQEEPVPIGECEAHVGAPEMLAGGDDVEHGQLRHGLRMVERHAIGAAPAAIVAGDEEALEPRNTSPRPGRGHSAFEYGAWSARPPADVP